MVYTKLHGYLSLNFIFPSDGKPKVPCGKQRERVHQTRGAAHSGGGGPSQTLPGRQHREAHRGGGRGRAHKETHEDHCRGADGLKGLGC